MLKRGQEEQRKNMMKIVKSAKNLHNQGKEKNLQKALQQAQNKKTEDQERELKVKMMKEKFQVVTENIDIQKVKDFALCEWLLYRESKSISFS